MPCRDDPAQTKRFIWRCFTCKLREPSQKTFVRSTSCSATLKRDVKYEKARTLHDYGYRCGRNHSRWKSWRWCFRQPNIRSGPEYGRKRIRHSDSGRFSESGEKWSNNQSKHRWPRRHIEGVRRGRLLQTKKTGPRESRLREHISGCYILICL